MLFVNHGRPAVEAVATFQLLVSISCAEEFRALRRTEDYSHS